MNPHELAQLIEKTLNDNKGLDITCIDVSELTDVMDSLIICTATSSVHAKALLDKLLRALRAENVKPFGIEGENGSEWVVVDCLDVVVHIMLEEAREFYSLEKLWSVTESAREKRTQ